jgi:threonine/homoserine/homoserine lactone efflux protein
MLPTSTLTAFVAVVLVLFVIPGPAVLLVLSRTVQGGRNTGIMTGLGIAAGDFVHALFAAVGLSAVLMASALAFDLVKLAGAAYLVYLGVRAFIEKPSDPSLPKIRSVTPRQAFLQAIPAEILNPETALFFLAFMPQFVHPERGSTLLQFATLGLIFVVLSSFYTTLLVLAIQPLGRLLKRVSWIGRWRGKIVGSIFMALGLEVATQHR